MSSEKLDYRQAGVDIAAGNEFVRRIKPHAARTTRPEVLTGPGGFASLFRLDTARWRDPVLVAGTDGVGTKLTLALATGRLDGLGRDLVAMCANDVAVTGAEPLFFLDYYATGKLDIDQGERLVAGIAEGCEEAGCALVGGETAELPGLYTGHDFDLAGFCVGAVERDRIIDGSTVTPGNTILGVASSGPHANGFSLIRRVLEAGNASLDETLEGRLLADWLLAPTTIYVRAIRTLIEAGPVHALAHITGGGLTENLPRALPEDTVAVVDPTGWPRPAIFDWLARGGDIENEEMYRVFNMGIGLAVILPDEALAQARKALTGLGLESWSIGTIEKRATRAPPGVIYRPA